MNIFRFSLSRLFVFSMFFFCVLSGRAATSTVFSGLLGNGTQSDGVSYLQSNGIFSVTVGARSVFTGSLKLGGKTLSMKGGLDSMGNATVPPIKFLGGRTVQVSFHLDPVSPVAVTGNMTISGNATVSEILIPFSLALGVSPAVGLRYTIGLPVSVGTTSVSGYGYATLVVTAKGVGTFAGKLADGTTFSSSVPLLDFGNTSWGVPLYIPLYSSKGLLTGEGFVAKSASTDTAEITGQLDWFRPSQPKSVYFPEGFLASLDLWGKTYQLGKNLSLVSGTGDSGNFTLTVGSGVTPLSQLGVWPKTNSPKLSAPPKGMTLTFNGATGVFQGAVPKQGLNGKVVNTPIQGVVFSSPCAFSNTTASLRGAGFCFTGDQSVPVELEDALVEYGTIEVKDLANGVEIVTARGGPDGRLVIPAFYNGKPVVSIAAQASMLNTSLKDIVIPDSVTSIGNSAFSGIFTLKHVRLPRGLFTIGSGVFSMDYLLKDIVIPSGVQTIGAGAFSCGFAADKLAPSRVTIPDSVVSMGDFAFSNSGLKNVIIPASVTVLGRRVFGWTDLESVEFLGDAPTMGSEVFLHNNQDYSNFTIYYHHGKSGFSGSAWDLYPVPVELNP